MLEGVVAGGVAEGVVDQLEAVEVEHQDGERVPVALVELHVPVQFLLQEPAVVQPGEGVGVRQAVEFGAGLLVVGLGGGGHDPVKGDAQDAHQLEDLLVLLAQTSGEACPRWPPRGRRGCRRGADPRGLVTLEKPEGRGLAVVEAARPELRPECPRRPGSGRVPR